MLNTALSTTVLGTGPDLVMLHGWGVHSVVWQFVAQKLAEKYRVTLVDLPGFGLSKTSGQDLQLENTVALILAVVPKNAVWMGWSLGGLLATYIAIHYPQQVEKLIAVASTPQFVQDANWPGMNLKILRQFAEQLQEDYEATVLKFLLLQFHGTRGYKAKLQWLEGHLFTHGKPRMSVLLGGLHLLETLDLREKLISLRCEVLYIFGRLDALIPSDISTTIKAFNKGIQCEVLPKAGHALFLSHEDEFLILLNKFLDEKKS